jgi:sugar/nucleoside kinase (ribokinase family)
VSGQPALDLITLGEGMVQFGARTTGPLRQVKTYDVHAAGSELNVAIGAARLGLRVGWISRLGADDFGDLLLSAVRAEGVDTSQVVRDGVDPTGIFVVQRGYPIDGHSSSIYYRAGSAGSRLSVAELDVDYLRRTAIFHTTGISLAVSGELAKAAATAGATAAASGARRSFDVNYRAKLWSADKARPDVEAALASSDIAFCSLEDARALWGVDDPEAALELIASFGPDHAVVACGRDGAIMAVPDGATVRAAAVPTQVVDATGAGDAFCATVLTGIARDWPAEVLLQRACLVGSIVCGVAGDNEGVPTLDELERVATNRWLHR